MDLIFQRIGDNLMARVTGPLQFRLLLQPLVAILFAVRAGLADARTGKPPYLWGLLSHPAQRRVMLDQGWKSIWRVFVLAVVLDAVYQFIVDRFVYPGEALLVAVLLALVPYLTVRGLVTRAAQRGRGARGPGHQR